MSVTLINNLTADEHAGREWRAYDKYRDSGIGWLGTAPAEWIVAPMKRFGTLQAGAGFPNEAQGLEDEDLPFLKVSDMNLPGNTIYIYRWSNSVSRETAKQLGATVFDAGTIIFPKVGAALLTNKRRILTRPSCMDNNVMGFTIGKGNGKWFYYWLSGLDLGRIANPGAVPSINESQVRKLGIVVPVISEQDAIAAFLDRETAKIDGLVAKKERLIALLSEKRTALISHAVTKGLDPNAPMKDSGVEWLGEIPAHWSVRHTKRIAFITYGVGGELDRGLEEGVRILSLPNVDIDGRLLLDDVPFVEIPPGEKDAVLLRQGDLLFNWRNGSAAHLGKTAYFDLDGEYTHVSFLLRLRFDATKHDSRFFQHVINGLRITGFFSSSKAGVNNTFNQSELESLRVMVPPLAEQRRISDFLSAKLAEIDRLIGKIRSGIDATNEYRTALISAAVTGKIDVRGEG